jgi:hypothetical protein
MWNQAIVASVRQEDGFGVVSNVASPHFERQLRAEGDIADGSFAANEVSGNVASV